MARRARRSSPAAASTSAPAGHDVQSGRRPCPCGSGQRYKHCHGSGRAEAPYVVRTFAGLPGECDWVALREFVPSARATLAINDGALAGALDGRQVEVVTILPGFAPALKFATTARSGSASRWATSPATRVGTLRRAGDALAGLDAGDAGRPSDEPPGAGPRLQDVVDPQAAFDAAVQEGFDFWFEGVDDRDGSIADNLEKLNESIAPTRRLHAVDAAYWVSTKSQGAPPLGAAVRRGAGARRACPRCTRRVRTGW